MSDDKLPSVFSTNGKVNVKDLQALANRAQAAAQNNPRGGAPGGSDYMNFSGKRGIVTIGKDKRRVENDERWVVDITSFEEGWVCWKGGQCPSSRMANIYTGVPIDQPAPDELGPFNTDKGDGWYQAKAMVLKSVDEDQQGYFKINSVSGVSAMAELIEEFAERANSGLSCWPVITIDVEEFEAQGFKNFKPVFNIEGWLATEQLTELAEGADVDDLLGNESEEEEPAPPPKKVEEKPTRGRRRRTA